MSDELVIVALADELVIHLETAASGAPWCASQSVPAQLLGLSDPVVTSLQTQAVAVMAEVGQTLSL